MKKPKAGLGSCRQSNQALVTRPNKFTFYIRNFALKKIKCKLTLGTKTPFNSLYPTWYIFKHKLNFYTRKGIKNNYFTIFVPEKV